MVTSMLWFRRDLRLADHPALRAAVEEGDRVVAAFVIDPVLWDGAGPVRRAWLAANLLDLDDRLGGRLLIASGAPARTVPALAAELGVETVHVSGETTPYGARRDHAVASALDGRGIGWHPVGCPYAVAPGSVTTGGGTPYQVFTPFSRAWREHGWPGPAPAVQAGSVEWVGTRSGTRGVREELRAAVDASPVPLPAVGESGARRRWREFAVAGYADGRDALAADRTSRMSPYLKLGVVHPRTLLADLAGERSEGARTFVTELAWREFYADVLRASPDSAWWDLKPALSDLQYDDADDVADAVEAWRTGMTGYPVVDAGMRQLLAEGWMHNRARMITASFLTKDLHVWWPIGARHFLEHLVDGDLASNNHGWQWVAGTGTDAAPYFRVFNPVEQGKRFDPEGDYVRRWVPELRHLAGAAVHEPWKHDDGLDEGYPARIVDHAAERREALARYDAARS